MNILPYTYYINNITQINRKIEKVIESNTKSGFWQHYCKAQKDTMYFEHGIPCDWCGQQHTINIKLTKDQNDNIVKENKPL